MPVYEMRVVHGWSRVRNEDGMVAFAIPAGELRVDGVAMSARAS